MLPQWRVLRGPEFAESLKGVPATKERLDDQIRTMDRSLRRDPFRFTDPFPGDELLRVFTLDDPASGYKLDAFIRVQPEVFSVVVNWLQMRLLRDDEYPDDFDDDY